MSCQPMLGIVLTATMASAQPTLDIYHVDVEGGAATLIVTPARESVLVDAGWPGNDGRDVGRIQAAMKAAGITRIDHLIVTHYHTDHVGGVPPLLAKVPVGAFYDHGADVAAVRPGLRQQLRGVRGGRAGAQDARSRRRRSRLKPAADAHAGLAARRRRRTARWRSRASAPRNARCGSVPAKPVDTSDNARSVGVRAHVRGLRFLRCRRPDVEHRGRTRVPEQQACRRSRCTR